jgi:hypothetical protein
MTVSTSDLNATDLAALLVSVVDRADAATLENWALQHLHKDGLTPVEIDSNTSNYINSLTPDAEGTNPQFLQIIGDDNTLGATGLHLNSVLFNPPGSELHVLRIEGSDNLSVYTGDLVSINVSTNGFYRINAANSTGTLHIYEGDANGDIIFMSNGDHSSAETGIGSSDLIVMGSGNHQNAILYGNSGQISGGSGSYDVLDGSQSIGAVTLAGGTGDHQKYIGGTAVGWASLIQMGSGDYDTAIVGQSFTEVFGGTGANDVIHSTFDHTNFFDGTGAVNQEVHLTGGHAILAIGNATSETLFLGGGGFNSVNVIDNASEHLTIRGITSTDAIAFVNHSGYTVTNITGGEEVRFGDGQVADLIGTHAALSAVVHYL